MHKYISKCIIGLILYLYMPPLSKNIFFQLKNCWNKNNNIYYTSGIKTIHANIMSSKSSTASETLRYLNQEEAIAIDQALFNDYKFSVDQLMELAGLSVASAIAKYYPQKKKSRILIVTGPGNNGGDGLVASRHLKLFGFSEVHVLNTRTPTKELYINLLHQAKENNIIISNDPLPYQKDSSIGLIIDALFGFSFRPPVREDFLPFMSILVNGKCPIVSVDIPSGWNVESGPQEDNKSMFFMPDMLISLTAPKLCAKKFTGTHHILGGRFVPEKLAEKYSMNLPEYPGIECIVKL